MCYTVISETQNDGNPAIFNVEFAMLQWKSTSSWRKRKSGTLMGLDLEIITSHPWNSIGQNLVTWSLLTVKEAGTIV